MFVNKNMKLNMKIVGTANVLNNISLWQKIRFREKIKNALNKTRLKIENDARRMAPKDTGALKASIWSEMKSDTQAVVADGVYYGMFQELGTRNHPPQPFLMPAFEANRKVLERELKEMLD